MEIQLNQLDQENQESPVVKSKTWKQRILGINRLFLYTVVIPTTISVIYFGLIASDVYISESRFVVRSPERQQSMSGLGALLQGAGFSKSQDDTYMVHDFMLSRDALHKLNADLALDKMFKHPTIDVFSRFASFGMYENFEDLFRYYQKHVVVDTDSSSSISVLKVNAYTPEDAYKINAKLLEMGESLINQLNERGRQDMIKFATSEVADAEQNAKNAALALAVFRNDKVVFDPERQSTLQLQLTSKLQDEIIANRTQLAQLRSIAPDNPQIDALKKRVASLKSEMHEEMAKVAGDNTSSLTNKAAEYERLALERVFADKQLASAVTSLELARNEAQRKQLYLERVVQPNKPDVALEPRRIRAIFTTFVLGLIVMGVLSILLAGVREHKD